MHKMGQTHTPPTWQTFLQITLSVKFIMNSKWPPAPPDTNPLDIFSGMPWKVKDTRGGWCTSYLFTFSSAIWIVIESISTNSSDHYCRSHGSTIQGAVDCASWAQRLRGQACLIHRVVGALIISSALYNCVLQMITNVSVTKYIN